MAQISNPSCRLSPGPLYNSRIELAVGCSLIILPHVPSMAKKELSALTFSAQGD